jgi:inner membrane protein
LLPSTFRSSIAAPPDRLVVDDRGEIGSRQPFATRRARAAFKGDAAPHVKGMDSLSQFALGAAVGVAVMGRRSPAWRAALWGGVLGTLPDLDVAIDHGDAVRDMVLHRAETHAFFWQALATPPLTAAIAAIESRRAPPGERWRDLPRWLLATFLALSTHALLDAMTVYGTRLALPFSDRPVGLGSIFIIDPLYTLPLLAGLAGALALRWPRGARWNLAGLALSTAYLGWSAAAQHHVEGVVRAQLATRPDAAAIERVLVTPTPFNTVLWRVLVMRRDGHEEGFRSLRDGDRPIRFSVHPHDPSLREELRGIEAVERVAAFSRGFFRLDERDGIVRVTDLRMGQEPAYVFSFAVARRASAPQALVPPVAVGGRGDVAIGAALSWLWRRAGGADIDPPRG